MNDEQLITLRAEAGEHGDTALVHTATAALDGDADARAVCERVIAAAQAHED